MCSCSPCMESQTQSSKRAPRELQNWRVQGNPPTLHQPYANPLPTLRQPFSFFLVTFSANPSPGAQRALRGILMPRGKNGLPTVSRQFLTRNYPHPNCLLKCLPNCLSRTGEGFFSSFKIAPADRAIARQLSCKNCLAAIFASRHQDASPGPLGLQPPLSVDPRHPFRDMG